MFLCTCTYAVCVCFFILSCACLRYSYVLSILNPCRHPGQWSSSPSSRSCSPHFIHCLTCHSLPGQLSACSKWLWHLITQATGREWERGTWYSSCQQSLLDWIGWERLFCSKPLKHFHFQTSNMFLWICRAFLFHFLYLLNTSCSWSRLGLIPACIGQTVLRHRGQVVCLLWGFIVTFSFLLHMSNQAPSLSLPSDMSYECGVCCLQNASCGDGDRKEGSSRLLSRRAGCKEGKEILRIEVVSSSVFLDIYLSI